VIADDPIEAHLSGGQRRAVRVAKADFHSPRIPSHGCALAPWMGYAPLPPNETFPSRSPVYAGLFPLTKDRYMGFHYKLRAICPERNPGG
jgi:hypothetical protein